MNKVFVLCCFHRERQSRREWGAGRGEIEGVIDIDLSPTRLSSYEGIWSQKCPVVKQTAIGMRSPSFSEVSALKVSQVNVHYMEFMPLFVCVLYVVALNDWEFGWFQKVML